MFGYIYITTNNVTGQQYIGKHNAPAFDSSYIGSGVLLEEAIKQFGRDNFSCQILEPVNNVNTICESLLELNAAEKYYIDLYNCVIDDHYYNLKPEGDGWSGGPVSEHTKKKISEYNINKVQVNNGKKCIKIDKSELPTYLAEGWVRGVPPFKRTEKAKKNIAESIKGQIGVHKGNHKTKVSPSQLDKYLLDGYELGWGTSKDPVFKVKAGTGNKKFMHKADEYELVYESNWEEYLQKGWVFGGRPRPNVRRKKGYKLSAEHKQHLSEAHIGHKQSKEAIQKQAEKLRGRIIVYKDNQVKLINEAELSRYLKEGWNRGRPKYSRSKEVVCFETSEVFSSISRAAQAIGRCTASLVECLQGSYTKVCGGKHWYLKNDTKRLNDLKKNINIV